MMKRLTVIRKISMVIAIIAIITADTIRAKYASSTAPPKTRQLQYKRHFYIPNLDIAAQNVNDQKDNTLPDRYTLQVVPGPTQKNPALIELVFKYYASALGLKHPQILKQDSHAMHNNRLQQDPEPADSATPHSEMTVR